MWIIIVLNEWINYNFSVFDLHEGGKQFFFFIIIISMFVIFFLHKSSLLLFLNKIIEKKISRQDYLYDIKLFGAKKKIFSFSSLKHFFSWILDFPVTTVLLDSNKVWLINYYFFSCFLLILMKNKFIFSHWI